MNSSYIFHNIVDTNVASALSLTIMVNVSKNKIIFNII